MAKAIFLEGTDGSGKSTQLRLLQEYLASNGEKVLLLREPGGTDYYEALRELYIQSPHEHPAVSDALISAAGRAANIEATKAALREGTWVITDRSYLSSYVYQSVQGVPLESIQQINAFALQGFAYDVKIIFDVPTPMAMQRVSESGTKKDYWESKGTDFFEQIRKAYLTLGKEAGCAIIDASDSPDVIHTKVKDLINQL